MGTTSELLRASDLRFAYGAQNAIDGVSLSVSAGEVVGLLGPNGSGKSTLIKLLLGSLPPAAGQVWWEGRPLSGWSRRQLARIVAYLPQAPVADPEQRVLDVLRLGRTPYLGTFGVETRRDLEVVQRVAASLDLTNLLHRPMDELSGGQRQRVFIGRCLAQEPRALLLDEPNTYLDLRHQVELCQWLVRLARQEQIAVVMALHDLSLAANFADRLLLLQSGKPIATGTPDEVLRPEVLTRVYGIPLDRLDHAGRPLIVPRV